jgi:hypothetical protein
VGTYVLVSALVVAFAQFAQPVTTRPSRFATLASLRETEEGVPRRTAINHAFALLAAAVLIGFAAVRWRIGTDYRQYEHDYVDYVRTPGSEMGFFDEPGIRVIAKIAARVHDDPTTMFAIASVITVGLTVYTIYKNTSALPLALLLYVLAETWQGSFNGVRQYLACAVVFAGHRFIIDRRFWRYLLVVLVAMLFHISAAIMLLAYLIPRRQLRPIAVLALMLVAAFAVNFYAQLGDVIDAVKGSDVSGGSYFAREVNPFRILLAFAPSVMYLLFTQRKNLSATGHFYANMMFINGVVFLAAAGSAYLARFGIYTSVFIALALPEMLNSRERSFRTVLILAVIALYGVFWYLDTSHVTSLNPYRSLFDR